MEDDLLKKLSQFTKNKDPILKFLKWLDDNKPDSYKNYNLNINTIDFDANTPPKVKENIKFYINRVINLFMNDKTSLANFINKFVDGQSNPPAQVPIPVPVQTNSVSSGCDANKFIDCICGFEITLIQLYIDFFKEVIVDNSLTTNDIFRQSQNSSSYTNSLDKNLLNKYVKIMPPSEKQNKLKKTIDDLNKCIIDKLKTQICEKSDKPEKFKYLQYIRKQNSTHELDDSIMTAIDNLRSQENGYIDTLFTEILDCITITDVEPMLCTTKKENIDELIKFLTILSSAADAFGVVKPGFMGNPLFEELIIYKLQGKYIQTLITHVEQKCREIKLPSLTDRICHFSNEIKLNYIKVIDDRSKQKYFNSLGLNNQICNDIWLSNTNRPELRNDIINCLTEKEETGFIDALCKSNNVESAIKFLSDLIKDSNGNINNYVDIPGYSNLPSDDIKETLIILKLKNKTANLTDLLKSVIKCYICDTISSDIHKLECIKYLCDINKVGISPKQNIKEILDLYGDKQELAKHIITCFKDSDVKSTEICKNESTTYDIAGFIVFMHILKSTNDDEIKNIVKNEYPDGLQAKFEILQKLQIYRLKNKNTDSTNMQKLINDVVECYVCAQTNDNSKKLYFIRHLCGKNTDNQLTQEELNILNAYENSDILKDKIILCLQSPDYNTLSDSLCNGNLEQEYVYKLVEFLSKLQTYDDDDRIFDIEKPQQMDKDTYENLIILKLKEPKQIQQLINHVNQTCIKCKPPEPTDPTRPNDTPIPKIPELKDQICCETDPIKKFGYIRYIGEPDKRVLLKSKYGLTQNICSQIDKFEGNTADLINHIVKCTVLPIYITNVCDDTYFTKFVKFIDYLISASGVDTTPMFAKAMELKLDQFDVILYPFVLAKLKSEQSELTTNLINSISDCYCNKSDVYQVLEFIEYLDGNNVNIPEQLSEIKDIVDKYKPQLRVNAIECLKKDTNITADKLITEICGKFYYEKVNPYIEFINSLKSTNTPGNDEIQKKIKILYLKEHDLKSVLITPICICLKEKVISFICNDKNHIKYYIEHLQNTSNKAGTNLEIIKVINLIKTNGVIFTDNDILLICKPPLPPKSPPPPPPPKNVNVNELSQRICNKFSDYNTVNSYIEFIKKPTNNTNGDPIKEDIQSLFTKNSTDFDKLLGLVCKCLKDKIIKAVCASGKVKSYIDYLTNRTIDGTDNNIISFIELLKIPNCDPLTVDDLKNESGCIKPETPPPPKDVDIEKLSKDICNEFPNHDKVKEYLDFIADTTQPPNGDPIKEDIQSLSTANPTDFPQLLQKVCDCLREAIVTAICDTTEQQSYIDYLKDDSNIDGTEPNIINFIELLNDHCDPLTEGEITAKCAPPPTPPPPTPPPPVKVISGDSASYVTDQEIVYIHKKDNSDDVIYEYEGLDEDRAIRQVKLNGHDVEVMDNGKWTKVDLTNFKRLYPKTNMISDKTADLFNDMVFTAKAVFDLIALP